MKGRSLARYIFLLFSIVLILLINLINLPNYSPPNYEADDCSTTNLSPWCNSAKNRRIKQPPKPTRHHQHSADVPLHPLDPLLCAKYKTKITKPISIEQQKGPSFTVEGHLVKWANREFHLKPDPIAEVIISRAMAWDPGTREFRNVMYKEFCSELFVP